MAADDFPDSDARNIIILITDGQEACDKFPCEVAAKLKAKGINVTPFVVGLGIDLKYLNDLNCIGRIYEANTYESFKKVMKSVISDALLNTTVQIDLNNINKSPTETDVTVFLYEAGTKNLKYTFMHTLNYLGQPDTITIIDPLLKYDLVVNTLPQVIKKDVSIYRNQHNIIPIDCPQGIVVPRLKGPTKKQDVQIRIALDNNPKTLNVQTTGQSQRYIIGKYDVEILTLPRIYIDNMEVNQSLFSYIDVPGSGLFKYNTHSPLVGQIFYKNPNGDFEWVIDFDDKKVTDTFFLQPGTYKVVYRQKTAVSTDYTTSKIFIIQSGENTFINL